MRDYQGMKGYVGEPIANIMDIDKYIYSVGGIRGIARLLGNKALNYVFVQAQNKFGINMVFSTDNEMKIITDWIRKNDKNFEKHISNPYAVKSKTSIQTPLINGFFVLKLRLDTLAFIKGTTSAGECRSISVYLFGKKLYKYYNQIIKMMDNIRSTNILYNISAYKSDTDSRWRCIGSTMTPRPMETIFLDGGIKNRIIDHLNTWIDNQDIYESRGLTYKTGILLYGKAGTGKSSLATAIATYLNCGLITIDPTTFQYLNISEVTESINADSNRYVILIDEIDTLFKSREDENMSDSQKEKTSKLLAFLDSQQSPTNVVFVATTNYIDRLDNALLRKGRFDLVEQLTDISRPSAIEMCNSFNVPQEKIDYIMNEVFKNDDHINPANLQSSILQVLKS